MLKKVTHFSIDHPKLTIVAALVITVILALQFFRIRIDTDPENMLEVNQMDRVFYDRVKEDFGIHDMIVLGVTDTEGIFRTETLGKLQRIAHGIVDIEGVIAEDVMSFATTDNVIGEGGLLSVDLIMDEAPEADEEVEALKQEIYGNPMFVEQLVSSDGKGAAIYIPIQQKDMSYRISKEVETLVESELTEGQEYYLAGLPIAEDTFGFEMFLQMGVMAPLAMLVIFLLLWFVFRNLVLIVSPMIVALFSVVWGMGALIGAGYTVHIMSSMIPIFLMPIAILDSVHMLSEFYDKYPKLRDKRRTLYAVTDELFTPMLYTSLTTIVGFGSLVLADIPPVQVFGAFVALGVFIAWFLTITLVPAFTMLIRDERLAKLGAQEAHDSWFNGFLSSLGSFAFYRSRAIIYASLLLLGLGFWGVSRIVVNDNPVKWFKPDHRLRIADREMNNIIGGTYMAYLVVEGAEPEDVKRPEVAAYIDRLQQELESSELVGKTSSVVDIVKRVNYVMHDSSDVSHVVPDSQDEIGQYLFLFEMSGDPNDLANYVDNDYQMANIWVQLKSGENRDMEHIIGSTAAYMQSNPPPAGIEIRWSGLTYINKVWQDLMVTGMLKSVLSGFAAVFVLMMILFRSPLLALISMMPLTFAIVLTYGILGFVGKAYDMPVAVCSSLALGLSVDYAIHFCQRFRSKCDQLKDLKEANTAIFGEPARAISRNTVVVMFGFLPLVFATLTPYMTVGIFFAALMGFSGLTTLVLLPALMRTFGGWLFRKQITQTAKVAATVSVGLLLGLFLAVSSAPTASAATLAADEIVTKSQEAFFYAGESMKANVHMRLISEKGKERIRDMTMLRKNWETEGEQRYFMHFSKPNDVRNMSFMVWKYMDKGDDRWIYVPAIKMVRRIAAKDERSSFVGSDFTYEDVSGRDPNVDEHTLVREEAIDGRDAYVIKSIPKEAKSAGHAERLSWIDKETFLPLKEEYKDKNGAVVRTFTAEEIQNIGGIPTVVKRVMSNEKNGHRTEVAFMDVAYSQDLPDDLFTERSLRNPPAKWIK